MFFFLHFVSLQLGVLCVDYLGQEGTSDEDLHQHGDDQLDDEEDDGSRTLLCDAAETIAYSSLGLQGEEESSCQGLHLHHTGRVVGWGVELCWRYFNLLYFHICRLLVIAFWQARV